ncbi:hypothetical protein D1872_248850 [compost metagenome]
MVLLSNRKNRKTEKYGDGHALDIRAHSSFRTFRMPSVSDKHHRVFHAAGDQNNRPPTGQKQQQIPPVHPVNEQQDAYRH